MHWPGDMVSTPHRRNCQRPGRKTTLWAAGLFVLDAFVLNQGAVALFVILLVLFVLLPRALWGLRTSRHLYLERVTKAGIYLLACVAVFVADALQNRMADRRAIELAMSLSERSQAVVTALLCRS
jgi:hypothetical protein